MIKLFINHTPFPHFESLQISRSLATLSGHFEISLLPAAESIRLCQPGAQVEILSFDQPLLVGYIDASCASLGSSEKTYRIQGRDKTSTLIDSSAVHNPMGFKSVTLSTLARALCSPFGIEVKSNLKTEKIHAPWCIYYGETVFEAIERIARIEGVLLLTSEIGELVITKPTLTSQASFSITEGTNLYQLTTNFSQKGLYRKYQITTFSQGLNNALSSIEELKDESVTLNKTLIIDAEGLPSHALAKERLTYELGMRKARARQITAHVPGWTDDKNTLFELNTLTNLKAPSLGLTSHYLISGLSFSLDQESGYSTQIHLTAPEAYFADPAAEVRLNTLFDLMRKDAAR